MQNFRLYFWRGSIKILCILKNGEKAKEPLMFFVFKTKFYIQIINLEKQVTSRMARLTGHRSNATLVAGAFTTSYSKCQKRGLLEAFRGFFDFFVLVVAEAF
jgi:hypothetical protein